MVPAGPAVVINLMFTTGWPIWSCRKVKSRTIFLRCDLREAERSFTEIANILNLKTGDIVAVEGSPGHDIGIVSLTGELVRFQLKKKNVTEDSGEIKVLYRLARPVDLEKWEAVKAQEVDTMYRARSIALET